MNIFKALFGSDESNLTPAEAKTYMQENKTLVILDVRQPEEFRGGHIDGAKLMPLGELSKRIGELSQDVEILCVCRSGSRSSAAAGQLKRAGFNVFNLRGGMMSWQSAGYPVKKGK